jgi:hypothetical protein
VGRDDEALDGGVFDEVDDAQLEGHRGLPVMAEEFDSDGDRVDSRRPTRGFA